MAKLPRKFIVLAAVLMGSLTANADPSAPLSNPNHVAKAGTGPLSLHDRLAQIKVGVSDKNQVEKLLGRPLVEAGHLDKWYYPKNETFSKKSGLVKQDVIRVEFNNQNKVVHIDEAKEVLGQVQYLGSEGLLSGVDARQAKADAAMQKVEAGEEKLNRGVDAAMSQLDKVLFPEKKRPSFSRDAIWNKAYALINLFKDLIGQTSSNRRSGSSSIDFTWMRKVTASRPSMMR